VAPARGGRGPAVRPGEAPDTPSPRAADRAVRRRSSRPGAEVPRSRSV